MFMSCAVKIKFSPNLIVEVCPVYRGQKQVGAFGCTLLDFAVILQLLTVKKYSKIPYI